MPLMRDIICENNMKFLHTFSKAASISCAIGFGYSSALQMNAESYITVALMGLFLVIDIILTYNNQIHPSEKQADRKGPAESAG